MPRTMYRRRRSTTMRRRPTRYRRTVRRRSRRSAVLTRQRYVRERLKVVVPVKYGQTPNGGDEWQTHLSFALQQPTADPVYWGFTAANRWNNLLKEYEQYAITGMKFRWVPAGYAGMIDPADSNKKAGV